MFKDATVTTNELHVNRWIQEVDVVRFPHTILEHCRPLPHLCEWVFTTDVISKLQVFRVLSPKL